MAGHWRGVYERLCRFKVRHMITINRTNVHSKISLSSYFIGSSLATHDKYVNVPNLLNSLNTWDSGIPYKSKIKLWSKDWLRWILMLSSKFLHVLKDICTRREVSLSEEVSARKSQLSARNHGGSIFLASLEIINSRRPR